MNDTSEEELDRILNTLDKYNVAYRMSDIKLLMKPLIKAYGLQQQIESLKGVKGCFANLQDAEEAVYIESSYIDPRIATLTALKKGTGTSNE